MEKEKGNSGVINVPELSQFIDQNPEVEVRDQGTDFLIVEPWGDDSVTILVEKSNKTLIDALNKLRLPPRFTAIWHRDSHDIEMIFGPLQSDNALRSRSFEFRYDGSTYKCEYADASARLCALARAADPEGPASDTDHRHLLQVGSFLRFIDRASKDDEKEMQKYALTSFWVRGVSIEEEELPDLARHLNFYMNYFDPRSPRILIHAEEGLDQDTAQLPLPHADTFPTAVAGRILDPYLLGLWESAFTSGDPVRAFLHSFQILEYAGFYYLRDDVMVAMRRILSAPDVCARLEFFSHQLMDVLADERMADEQKIVEVVQRAVDPKKVWNVIEPRTQFFAEQQEFEGGVVIPALIKKGWTLDDFAAAWIPRLPDSLRRIRNALVHAREQRLAKSISPTQRNRNLLRPWSDLALTIAKEVILFERVNK